MAIRIDLPELGDGQYVEMKDPKFLSWGVQKQITELVVDDGKTAAQLDVAEKIAVALVKSGYVLNEDGVAVVFPLTDATVKDIPSIIVEKVSTKFAELKNSGADRKN